MNGTMNGIFKFLLLITERKKNVSETKFCRAFYSRVVNEDANFKLMTLKYLYPKETIGC